MASLTDDELDGVYALFDRTNHKNIPIEFWFLAPKVRVLIQDEKARRAERQANLEALTGDAEA